MEHKDVYSRVSDIHKHIFEQLKFAETKNNILLVFTMALFTFSIKWYTDMKGNFGSNFSIVFIICIAFPLVSALLSALSSFFPILFNKENETTEDNKDCNIYFFKDLAKINREKLLEIITQNIDDTEKNKIIEDKYINDMLNQICTLSNITLKKHNAFKRTMEILIFLVMLVFALIIFWFIVKSNNSINGEIIWITINL